MKDNASPRLREISPEALKRILEAHRRWVESTGEEGERADLSHADLQGVDLSGAQLQGANLTGTLLHEANLAGADLGGANGLLPGQLAGANLSGAQLPEPILQFEGLLTIGEMSHMASMLFITMLLGCGYVWLTLAATIDAELLTNSASSELPIIATKIPIVGFYWAAPLCLLALYGYFHLFLLRLWEELAELPAVFPDGKPLDKKVYPWLLNDLVRAYLVYLKDNPPPLFHLQKWFCIGLAWWMVPLTMVALWLRYLPRHDWAGTSLHVILVVTAIVAGFLFHRLAATTLRRENRGIPPQMVKIYPHGAVVLGVGLALGGMSVGAIEGVNTGFKAAEVRSWAPAAFALLGYSPFADFREVDVSTRPENWMGKHAEERALVKGAYLKGKNLRYANASRAFLVNADLSYSDLQGSVMQGADLRGANLEFARLQGADLELANLKGANLYGADLEGAGLNGADLQGATLSRANLQGASLYHANLEGADLEATNLQGASLQEANLSGADLRSPVGLTQEQIDQACTDEKTWLAEGFRPSGRTCPTLPQ